MARMTWPWVEKAIPDKVAKTAEVKEERVSQLSILLQGGNRLVYHNPFIYSKIEPWVGFYRWFFGRASESYIMRYEDPDNLEGECMFMRKDITMFYVEVKIKRTRHEE